MNKPFVFRFCFLWSLAELAYTMEVNERLDVYSFGVLTLEVLMGRHPGDFISSLTSSSTLSSSSPLSLTSPPPPTTAYGILLKDVLDMRLPSPRNHMAEQVVVVAKLALACLHSSPRSRPTMRQVSVALSKKSPTLQDSFYKVTIGDVFDINYSTS